MGIYSEYLSFPVSKLEKERKRQLKRIAEHRDRDVIVYAADFSKPQRNPAIAVEYPDILCLNDQLANLQGNKLDLILQTPGGSGEVAEDLVRLIRSRYDDLAVIIPGWAKSAGTIIAMAGDEILMEPASALGPIDAQIEYQGKRFSADALLQGFQKIKDEVTETGILNKAYIPLLQGISPADLESALNAQGFARVLVTDWLANYKFKSWKTHSGTDNKVKPEEREARAAEIAEELANHQKWRTHGRSIKLDDLERMGLKITDYSKDQRLADAIRRYHVLLHRTFEVSAIFKVFETPDSQVYRLTQQTIVSPAEADHATIQFRCPNCGRVTKIQVNFRKGIELEQGCIPFPADNRLKCPGCSEEHDLRPARNEVEKAAGKPIELNG